MAQAPTVHLSAPKGLYEMRPSASVDRHRANLQISLLCASQIKPTDFNESLHTDRPERIVRIFRYADQTP